MSFLQFGVPPPKSLSQRTRAQIAQVLRRTETDLADLFPALEAILTAHSPQAKPLTEPARLRKARADLSRIAKASAALSDAFERADEQVKLRIALGSVVHKRDEEPLGDFSVKLAQFRELVRSIDSAVAPARGGRTRADHLRVLTYYCAIQYHHALGTWPARRPKGPFAALMRLLCREIELRFPRDPYNILKPAIDAAESTADTPEQS